jgi:hypothetical protein
MTKSKAATKVKNTNKDTPNNLSRSTRLTKETKDRSKANTTTVSPQKTISQSELKTMIERDFKKDLIMQKQIGKPSFKQKYVSKYPQHEEMIKQLINRHV